MMTRRSNETLFSPSTITGFSFPSKLFHFCIYSHIARIRVEICYDNYRNSFDYIVSITNISNRENYEMYERSIIENIILCKFERKKRGEPHACNGAFNGIDASRLIEQETGR